MAEIIPKEKLGGFQRWQVGSFDRPKPATAAQPVAEPLPEAPETEMPPSIALPTAEEIERIYEEARSAGYQSGFEEGKQAAEQQGEETARVQAGHFFALSENLQKALGELDQNVADQLLTLATEIAGQVIRAHIAVKNDLLLPIIREAIAALPLHHTHLTLRLHPDDAGRIRALLGEQLAQSGAQIVEDGDVSPGGCLLRAGSSEVDASIETRWKRVLEAIGAEPRAWLS